MRIVGTIRPVETKAIEVNASSYEEGQRLIQAEVPEGWQLLSWRIERDPK